MNRRAFRIGLWLGKAPFAFGGWVHRSILRLGGAWILATRDALACPGCGAEVPLQGWYRCDWCQAQFLGGAFQPCPTPGCVAVPAWIPCGQCGHSVWNPMMFGS